MKWMIGLACLVLIACGAVATREPVTFTVTEVQLVIEVSILDPIGFPVYGAALFSTDGQYSEIIADGAVVITATGPVTLIAYRPGFAPSLPTYCVRSCEIRMYPLLRAN
jgi:hypothetical protein